MASQASNPCVYFARGSKTKLVKIGFTTDLESRMAAVAHHTKQSVTVLKTVPGGYAEEQAFHLQFTAYRTSAKGEWFRHEGDLRDFIRGGSSQKRGLNFSEDVLLPRGLVVGFSNTLENEKALLSAGVDKVWCRSRDSEILEWALAWLRGRPGTLAVAEDLRCLGPSRKEMFATCRRLKAAGVAIFDVRDTQADELTLLERAERAMHANAENICHKTRQRRGRKGGQAKGIGAAAKRDEAVRSDILDRLVNHPKLFWRDILEILGDGFSKATLRRHCRAT